MDVRARFCHEHGMSTDELASLALVSELSPDVVDALLEIVLTRSRSLDPRGAKTAFRSAIERILSQDSSA